MIKDADEFGNEMFQRTTGLEEDVLLLPEKYPFSGKKLNIKSVESALEGVAAVV